MALECVSDFICKLNFTILFLCVFRNKSQPITTHREKEIKLFDRWLGLIKN